MSDQDPMMKILSNGPIVPKRKLLDIQTLRLERLNQNGLHAADGAKHIAVHGLLQHAISDVKSGVAVASETTLSRF
eukprot:1324342-Amphidinium_carterae.1